MPSVGRTGTCDRCREGINSDEQYDWYEGTRMVHTRCLPGAPGIVQTEPDPPSQPVMPLVGGEAKPDVKPVEAKPAAKPAESKPAAKPAEPVKSVN